MDSLKLKKGFTVIELIFVIAIAGILTSLAVYSTVKWMQKIKVRTFAMKVLSDLEWAKSLAFKYGSSRVKFDNLNNTYTISADNFTDKFTVEKGIRMEVSEKLLEGDGLKFGRNKLPKKNGHILISDEDGKIKYLICIHNISGRIRIIESPKQDNCTEN